MKLNPERIKVLLVVTLVFIVSAALFLRSPSHTEVLASRQPLSSFPMQFEDWKGQDVRLDDETKKLFGPDSVLVRNYDASQQQPSIFLFVHYFPMRFEDQLHSEDILYRASGWVLTQQAVVQIARPDGSSFPVNRDVLTRWGGQSQKLVVYWYQGRGHAEASRIWAKYHVMSDSIYRNRSDGALVRFSTYMNPDETPETAFARSMRLGSNVIPMLDRYIPR